jgi:hypothetical protein
MDLYHLTLFVHILAVLVAAGATAVMKLAIGRRSRARTVGELLEWHTVLINTSKLFPMVLATFVITGSYMLSMTQTHIRSTGFVVAGLVGVALLLMSGIFLSVKGKALKQMLDGMVASNGPNHPAPKLVAPPIISALPLINTGIALSVVLDMVTKPASIATALLVVAGGIVLSAAIALRPRARVSAEQAAA